MSIHPDAEFRPPYWFRVVRVPFRPRPDLAARGLGVPGVGIEMLEDELVYVVADGVGLHQDVSNWTKASFNRCCIASPQSRGFRWP